MKHLSAIALADMLAALAATATLPASILDPGAPTAPPRVRHDVPFNKRAEGRARRQERREVRAAKSAWLNS